MNNELVSIIIPCFNSAKFIENTLDSLLAQTYKKIQVVCVDDGSVDNTSEILIKYSGKFEYFILVKKENGGIESAIKEGLEVIKGEYTFLHGHDDKLSQDAVEKAVLAFKDNIDAVRMELFFIDEKMNILRKMQDRTVLNGKEALIKTIGWNIHTFCLWRTSLFLKLKDVSTGGMMDFDELGTRYLYSQANKVGFCEGIYFYLQHDNSVSKKLTYRFFDRLYTHTLLRKLLINADVYDFIKKDLEKELYLEVVNLSKIFKNNKDKFSKAHKKRVLKFHLLAFRELNKEVLIKEIGIFNNRHRIKKIIGNFSLKNYYIFSSLINRNII